MAYISQHTPWQPNKMPKNAVLMPGNDGTVAVVVLRLTQESLELAAGNLGKPSATVGVLPDGAESRPERMCASALVDDPGVVHEFDGYGLSARIDDDWFRHSSLLPLGALVAWADGQIDTVALLAAAWAAAQACFIRAGIANEARKS